MKRMFGLLFAGTLFTINCFSQVDVTYRDITADRGDGTGVVYLGPSSNGRFFYWNGSGYYFGMGGSQQAALHAGNFNSYAPTLAGAGASGNWNISITGSARQWGDQTYLQTDGAVNSYILGFGSDGNWHPTGPNFVKSWLGIPTDGETLQSVTERNGITNKALYVTGEAAAVVPTGTATYMAQFPGYGGIESYDFNTHASKPFTINPNGGNVGIGTTSPNYKLDVNGNIFSTGKIIAASGIGFRNSTYIIDAANPIWSFENASQYGLAYYQGSTAGYDRIGFHFGDINNPPFYIKDNGSGYFAGDVTIGTTTAQKLLAVNGNIKTRKVTVTQNSWPDYVFDSSYQLSPLYQVEKYIQQNKHLPDVPSAAEVKKDGVDLGDNQAVLLKKIEELTLYIIEQNKKLEAVCQEVKALKENRK